jgi:hypothetical protein
MPKFNAIRNIMQTKILKVNLKKKKILAQDIQNDQQLMYLTFLKILH